MKTLLAAFGIFLGGAPLFALTVEVDRLDEGKSYAAIQDTESVKYAEQCARGKFDAYEWKTWEGYYSVRAFIEPIAIIKVRREPNEIFGGNLDPFIKAAQGATGKMGGNIFCFIKMKKNPRLLEPEVMIFRAYKQLFQAGNAAWESFFATIMNQGNLLTLADIQAGEKTKDILEKQQAAPKPVRP